MLFSFVLTLLFAVVTSKPTARVFAKRQDTTEPICGQIIDAANQGFSVFYASDAYDCLISVPFNPAVALRFIDYFNTTLQFQSTLAYLKNPPTGYQQPAVDVYAELARIKDNLNSAHYQNEYAFETDVQLLAYKLHDGHVDILAGILSAFSFASPYYISSVSVDGKAAPQIFLTDDVVDSQSEGWTPSPIVTINGEEVIQFLTEFAALQSVGTLEPHADWNQLMASPAQDIQGLTNIFGGGATFYPGDSLNFTFANKTTIETNWLAYYDNADYTGPLTTGGDFYNFFVLGLLPASYNESLAALEAAASTAVATTTAVATSTAASTTVTSTSGSSLSSYIMSGLGGNDTAGDSGSAEQSTPSWFDSSSGAYPANPDIVQPDLSTLGGGVVTGYFLNDTSTAVLSIPTFEQFGNNLESFVETVSYFVGNATEKKIQKVIIDLQQNTGGAVLLALTTFSQFFPNTDPFGGSRRRVHALENILGETITGWWDALDPSDEADRALHYLFAASEWVVTDRINAETDDNFQSWSEFNQPQHYHEDAFSLVERYNLSDLSFDTAAFDVPFSNDSSSDSSPTPQPWQPNNIVLLTDGLCSSACALFVEMMTHDGGVHVVTMGGNPSKAAPMQAASGNRGAVLYDAGSLDFDFDFAGQINDTAATMLPQDRDSGIFTYWMGFNLRDQIRENDEEPLQFKYLAADCRLYYTLANTYNMSRLWRDVAQAYWNDQSLCVPGSTGFAAAGNTTVSEQPLPNEPPPASNSNVTLPEANFPVNTTIPDDPLSGGLQDAAGFQRSDGSIGLCDASGFCGLGSTCKSINILCKSQTQDQTVRACLPSCKKQSGCSDSSTFCLVDTKTTSKFNSFGKGQEPNIGQSSAFTGLCTPKFPTTPGTVKLGCPS